MSDRTTIYLDYKKAKGLAKELDDAAAKLRKEYRRIEGCRRTLARHWKGTNAENFIGKMDRLLEKIGGIALQLDKSAGTIRDNAETIYKAEMKAAIIAEMGGSNPPHVISR